MKYLRHLIEILIFEGQPNRAFDFLTGRKYGRKYRKVKLVFRQLKAQIYWPTTDQNVRVRIPVRLFSQLDVKVLSKVTETITIEVNVTQSVRRLSSTETLGEGFFYLFNEN